MTDKPPIVSITENNTPISNGERPGDAPKTCGCGGKKGGACGGDAKHVHDAAGSCCVKHIAIALIIALGLGAAGCFVGKGIRSIPDAHRVIDVRGLAERNVEADLAIWNIGFVATGNDIADAQSKIEADSEKIRAFLKQNGLTDDEILELPTSMVDLLSRDWRSDGASQSRYIVNAGLRVRSGKVREVRALSGMKIGALIKSGVTLRENQAPVYLYTKLKDIKPDMVEEATADARRAAEKFAKDSGARLGTMKSASQGLFQIQARDQASGVTEDYEIDKTVRVVTTSTYFVID